MVADGIDDGQAQAQHNQPRLAPSLQEGVGTIDRGRTEDIVIEDVTEETAVPQEAEYREMNVKDRTNIVSDPGHRKNKQRSLMPRKDRQARRILTGLSLKAPILNLRLARKLNARDIVETK